MSYPELSNSFEVVIMTKKIFSLFLTTSILFASFSTLAAQTGSAIVSWDTLKTYVKNEVAVKAENKKTVFGILTAVTDDAITVRTADKNNAAEVSFRREDVEKIWFADLSASSRKTLLGAAIGAGVGGGIGYIALKTSDGQGGGYGAAVPFYAAIGAVAGGLVGFFVKDKNKKEQLIYRK